MAEIISQEPVDQPESEPGQVCKEHEGILDQYCSECNELLCSKCIHDPKHKEHLLKGDIYLAHTILPKRLDTLSEKLEPAASLVTQAGEMKQQAEKKKENIASNCEETKGEIEVFFEGIRKQLEYRERSLISAVEENANMKLALLEEHSQMIEESQMSAMKATEAINRLCQTRDIHSLTEDQRISENIQQCQQSLEKLDAELSNPDLNLILKFKEDTSLESQLSTLGKLAEYEYNTSLKYLMVKHQLTVGRDGKIFKDGPGSATVQKQYVIVAERNENYAEYEYWSRITRSASTPNLDQLTKSCPPDSPTEESMLPPQQSPQLTGDFCARNSESQIPPRLQAGVPNSPIYICPFSSGDEPLYDTVPLEIAVPPNASGNDDGVYVEMFSAGESVHTPQPSASKGRPSLPITGRMLISDSKREASDSGLWLGRPRADTMPFDHTSQPSLHLYETVLIPPLDRYEPTIIEPVRVIDVKQLCHTSSNNKVYPVGIQCASGSDNIMITDIHNHCLKQLDKDGSLIETIGSEGRDDGQFKEPTALAIGAGYMYATDLATNGRVQKFSKYGLFVNKGGKRHLRKPCGVAISNKDQCVYISDSQKQQVCIYDGNCRYVGSIGKAEGVKFDYPVGIAFDTAGNLLVLDRGQRCSCIWQIDISKPKAEVIAKIGEGYLHYPFGITVTQDGSIVVTERGNLNCVFVFSSRGELIQCFGKTGSKPGMFNSPSGVTVNSKGQIIVADTYNQRLQVFSLHQEEMIVMD